MGLGKTLSMIALIAADKEIDTANDSLVAQDTQINRLDSTLVVVPLSCKIA